MKRILMCNALVSFAFVMGWLAEQNPGLVQQIAAWGHPVTTGVPAIDWFISTGLVPLSFAIVAPVTAAIGARNTLMIAGGLGAAVTFAFLWVPGVRAADHLASPEPGPDPAMAVAV